jgi:hypothetical protein
MCVAVCRQLECVVSVSKSNAARFCAGLCRRMRGGCGYRDWPVVTPILGQMRAEAGHRGRQRNQDGV